MSQTKDKSKMCDVAMPPGTWLGNAGVHYSVSCRTRGVLDTLPYIKYQAFEAA